MTMTLLIDTLILVLLAGSVIYAIIVDRRLRRLKAALDDFRPALEHFAAAADRTEGSVSTLRSVADRLSSEGPQPSGAWREGVAAPDAALQQKRAVSVLRTGAKAELVRSFFEEARRRHA
jgi:hypothetical protein